MREAVVHIRRDVARRLGNQLGTAVASLAVIGNKNALFVCLAERPSSWLATEPVSERVERFTRPYVCNKIGQHRYTDQMKAGGRADNEQARPFLSMSDLASPE